MDRGSVQRLPPDARGSFEMQKSGASASSRGSGVAQEQLRRLVRQ